MSTEVKNEVQEEEQDTDEKFDLSEFYNAEPNEIGLLHQHLKRLPDFSAYKDLKTLVLRQNLLQNLDGCECLTALRSLDCYLNLLDKVPDAVLAMPRLEWLDFSFNSIRRIENLGHCVHLRKLFFVNNKIKKIG